MKKVCEVCWTNIWYPKAMDREYGPRRKWDSFIDPKRPPMNDLCRHWSNHLTNEFDRASNIFHLLKKVYSDRPSNVALLVDEKWFKHITKNVAMNHWSKLNEPLQPSPYLNKDMDSDQYSFLNPTTRDVTIFLKMYYQGPGTTMSYQVVQATGSTS